MAFNLPQLCLQHGLEVLTLGLAHIAGCLAKIYTFWLFNIAVENGPFIDDFPINTSIYKGFSMAMLNNQMVSHGDNSRRTMGMILWMVAKSCITLSPEDLVETL